MSSQNNDATSQQQTPQLSRRRRQQDETSHATSLNQSTLASTLNTPSVRRRNASSRSYNAGEVRWRGEGKLNIDSSTAKTPTRPKSADPIQLDPSFDDGPQNSSSFKGWLMGNMLGALNTAAGFTISTTGAILQTPIALTQNVVLPGVLAIIVETIDSMTPPRLQDWFRILSSSVYNFFTVLKSTEQGKRFRQQFVLFVQSIFELWSSPESRQTAVDGMAAAVKFADALHTPEMELFLEQASVVGCRLVDSMASGNTKQLIQNGKSLIWQGIELAVDPSTTAALAEVTAHLCHALEELGDSFHPTPRVTRNFQNEAAYLSTAQTTEYQAQSIETVILSSLGIQYQNSGMTNFDNAQPCGTLSDDNSTVTANSVPSNVAFDPDAVLSESDVKAKDQQARLKERTDKVNVKLLQEQILTEGRPLARSYQASGNPDQQSLEDLDEEIEIKDPLPPGSDPKLSDVVKRLESNREKDEDESPAVRFYTLVDDLLQQKQIEKQQNLDRSATNEHAHGKAKVKSFRESTKACTAKKTQPRSKKARDEYSNLRRIWKYPPTFLYLIGAILAFVCTFWVGFGMYGMYTFYQVVQNNGHPPTWMFSPTPAQPLPRVLQSDQNEIVVRIIKEVVHVKQDGSQATDTVYEEEPSLSKEELDQVLNSIAT